MTIENVCRINVWPTMAEARAAFDGADGSELCGRMIVWPTTKLAKEYYTENSGEEGGGGAPEWVPSDAKIHIDFLGGTPQGRAWVDGTGEVAIETLLGTDANTEEAWATTGYDPACITPDGYLYISAPPALIGEARDLALGSFTMRVLVKTVTAVSAPFAVLGIMSSDGNDGFQVRFVLSTVNGLCGDSWSGPLDLCLNNTINSGVGAVNCAAFTVAGARYDEAANGSAAVSGTIGALDRPPGNPFVAALVDVGTHVAVQSITIYDPLPTTAGLSALSQIT